MPPTRQNVKHADWTEMVKPFWPAVLLSSLKLKSLKVMARSRTVRRGALAILVSDEGGSPRGRSFQV